MYRKFALSLPAILAAVALLTAGSASQSHLAAADEPGGPTKLRVALFALADSHPMQEVIRAKWRAKHPLVQLEFVSWDSYKVDPPADVDVFEYDAIFLEHMAHKGVAAKLSPDDIKDRDDYFAYALDGSKVGDTYYGIPRIACTPILFYRKGDAEIEKAKSIKELFWILGDRIDAEEEPRENEGLLIDLSGSTTCACYYLDAVADVSGKYTTTPALPGEDMLDKQAVENLRLLTRMAGRKQALVDDYNKRCDWFAQGKGRAFVAWTERLSAIPVEKHKSLAFRPFPLAESNAVNLLYVDVLSLNPKLTEERRKLALEFANFVASKDLVVATFLVRNERTKSPQYLLPVRKSVLEDKQFRAEAPFYESLASISESEPKPFRIGAESRTWFGSTRKAIQKTIIEVK